MTQAIPGFSNEPPTSRAECVNDPTLIIAAWLLLAVAAATITIVTLAVLSGVVVDAPYFVS
jgi:hypothetical protein